MERVAKVEVVGKYRLYVEFEDGVKGEINLSERLFGPIFEPLKDAEMFSQARIDDFGAICWPNGADLAPDALYRQLTQKQLIKARVE